MDKEQISIIMPVYNAATHLAEALESVRAQTFKDWECICIDDGSTDSSEDILSRFVSTDARFRVMRRPNAGPGAARNLGLANVRTSFFFFMDADDALHPRALERLVAVAAETGADVVSSAFSTSKERLSEIGEPTPISDPVEQMCSDRKWRGTVWGRLYRRSACGGARFPEWNNHEDVAWSTEVFAKATHVIDLSAPLYFYRPSPGGLSSSPEAELSLPRLWRRQAEICPRLRPRLGELAYACWKSSPKSVGTSLLLRLRKERVVSFESLSPSKRLRLFASSIFCRKEARP